MKMKMMMTDSGIIMSNKKFSTSAKINLFYNLFSGIINEKINITQILILRLLLKITTSDSWISFRLNIILMEVFLSRNEFFEAIKILDLMTDSYRKNFSPEHHIWKSQKLCRRYGKLLYSCRMFAYNYKITVRNKENYAEIISKSPAWSYVSCFYMNCSIKFGVKINKIMLKQLTHSHLYWADELKSNNDIDGTLSVVRNILLAHRIDLTDIFISDILLNFENYLLKKETSSDVFNNLKYCIEKNNPVYPVTVWLCLYNILIFNGLLQCGFIARKKAIEQAFAEAESEPENSEKNELALLAAFDRCELSLAEKFLKQLQGRIKLKKYNKLQAYYFLLTGDIGSARKIWDRYLKKTDKVFADYFNNKKVAIVGPAFTGLNSGSEIDSYDIVIRFNYMGENSLSLKEEFGAKINITLYAATFLKIKKDEPKQFVKDLNFYYIKHQIPGFTYTDLKRNKAKLLIKNVMFFNKKPNAVPCILYDLLHFKPSKIKVFNSNFFLSEKPYYKNYPGLSPNGCSSKLPNVLPLLTYHDLVSQISFVRNLWERGLIEVDQNCADILAMNDDEYMRGMERMF